MEDSNRIRRAACYNPTAAECVRFRNSASYIPTSTECERYKEETNVFEQVGKIALFTTSLYAINTAINVSRLMK